MNKKKLNIILIPCAIAVWAIIIFKIVTYTKAPDNESFILSNNAFSPDSTCKDDTIVLFANYRDPFKPSAIHLPTGNTANRIKPVINPPKPVIVWPDIVYGGLIKNTRKGRQLALVTISARTIVVERNKEVAGVQILAIYPDSIRVQLQKEVKTISKK